MMYLAHSFTNAAEITSRLSLKVSWVMLEFFKTSA